MSYILLPYDKPMLKGTLIRRYQRFLADVALADSSETVTVHVPDSGSMLSCSEPGSKVLLSDSRKLESGELGEAEYGHGAPCPYGVQD
jgi:DNA-binding sugar fermentation-stimulating protein